MRMHLFGNLPNACVKWAKQSLLPKSRQGPSEPHAEDFIFRAKAPADNVGKGVGGWVRQGYFWQQDARVCLEWNKQIRFLSTQWGYLKRHFRPSMSIFFFFNLKLSACRIESIPLPHNPNTPTHTHVYMHSVLFYCLVELIIRKDGISGP